MRYAQKVRLDPVQDLPLNTFQRALGCMRATVDGPSSPNRPRCSNHVLLQDSSNFAAFQVFSHTADDCDRITKQRV